MKHNTNKDSEMEKLLYSVTALTPNQASWGCLRACAADDNLSQVVSLFFGIFSQFKNLLEVMNHILVIPYVQALPEWCKYWAPHDVALGVQISTSFTFP